MRKFFSAKICQGMTSICRGRDIVLFLGCGRALASGAYIRRVALSTGATVDCRSRWVKHLLTDYPPLQRRCRSRARASLRNRHRNPPGSVRLSGCTFLGVRRRQGHRRRARGRQPSDREMAAQEICASAARRRMVSILPGDAAHRPAGRNSNPSPCQDSRRTPRCRRANSRGRPTRPADEMRWRWAPFLEVRK
jgi:hypothetical protein